MTGRRQREVLSPILTTPNVPHRTPSNSQTYISPSTNRATSITSPAALLMAEQDDEKEKRARRRSRVMDLQRKNLGSPSSPADRRRSLPLSGLSTAQLTEHYTSCIKLSAENKINAKNAFGLHLIDYMSELLKKKELENFQVASTTLDASAKIYAGRVDAIHAETYKVLSGLGRSSDKHKENEEPEEVEGEASPGAEGEQEGEAKQKKKKKMRKSKTIETNLKNINVNKFDLEFEVDPLFHMMSAAFDEGGSSGLLLNNLRSFDSKQQLILDSNTVICPIDDPDTSRLEERQQAVDVTEIKAPFTDDSYKNLQICPTLSSFTFTNWDSSDKSSISNTIISDHRFDMEAEPEPIPAVDDNMSIMGGGDGSFHDMDDVEDIAETNFDDIEGVDHCIGDGKAAKLVQSVLQDMTHGTTGALMQVLSTEPSDYSYFNKALLRTWAGPAHWRAGNLSKDSWKSITAKSQKSKAKKPVFRVDLDEEIDFEEKFKPSKATSLTRTTLNKYSKDQTTLPKDHHYDADKLFRLFLFKRKMIRRQENSANIDDAIENYDYENVNDRENYCPDEGGNDDDDDESGDIEFGNFTAGTDFSQESGSQDPFSQSQDTSTQLNPLDNLEGTILSGDKLLAQPYKVNKIDIDYAKTAKKLDVKRLKSCMWELLKAAPKPTDGASTSNEGETDKNNSADASTSKDKNNSSEVSTSKSLKEMEGTLLFQNLLKDLPGKVSGQTAKNLSVPIAFVCLLHLANEKTLKIEEVDMQDLKITQGL